MAFDYGSIDLGIKNPFKREGMMRAIRGAIQTVVAVTLLLSASSTVKEEPISGWIMMVFGMAILGAGIIALGTGIHATFRYFVGRNHPTSLAQNCSKSQASTSRKEQSYVAYDASQLEEMLFGRKNTTFREPAGFLARLMHSLMPKLLFLPYPLRNKAQQLFGAWVSTVLAIVCYAVVAFISLAGFAGEAGEVSFPIYSAFLALFLIGSWFSAGRPLSRQSERSIDALSGVSLTKVISLSFLLPVGVGLIVAKAMEAFALNKSDIDQIMASIPDLHTNNYLMAIFFGAVCVTMIISVMFKSRVKGIDPRTEVSELRENWQESIHPSEVFINLDNLVMANRRRHEVPNRVYRDLKPNLEEQTNDKGKFDGELLQEVQPQFKPMKLGRGFETSRLLALVTGNLLYLFTLSLTVMLAHHLVEFYQYAGALPWENITNPIEHNTLENLSHFVFTSLHLILAIVLISAFARILINTTHVFYAEMQFESLLVYCKCEGTFTESKISTGTAIYDSTSSENRLIRSSITPWFIVSRIISTTFADTGPRNLEHPRYIMEMHQDEEELEKLKSDMLEFLTNRESIAAITSAQDIGNASQIHQLNQLSRASHTPTETQLEEKVETNEEHILEDTTAPE